MHHNCILQFAMCIWGWAKSLVSWSANELAMRTVVRRELKMIDRECWNLVVVDVAVGVAVVDRSSSSAKSQALSFESWARSWSPSSEPVCCISYNGLSWRQLSPCRSDSWLRLWDLVQRTICSREEWFPIQISILIQVVLNSLLIIQQRPTEVTALDHWRLLFSSRHMSFQKFENLPVRGAVLLTWACRQSKQIAVTGWLLVR